MARCLEFYISIYSLRRNCQFIFCKMNLILKKPLSNFSPKVHVASKNIERVQWIVEGMMNFIDVSSILETLLFFCMILSKLNYKESSFNMNMVIELAQIAY